MSPLPPRIAVASAILMVATTAVAYAADTAVQPSAAAALSPLADIVRASGNNLLTAAVGVVAVLAVFLGRNLEGAQKWALMAAAVALTLVAIAVTHFGTQDALAFEQEKAKLDLEFAISDSINECLDTMNTLRGSALTIIALWDTDQNTAEKMAFGVVFRLGDIVQNSDCDRPD